MIEGVFIAVSAGLLLMAIPSVWRWLLDKPIPCRLRRHDWIQLPIPYGGREPAWRLPMHCARGCGSKRF